MEIIKELKGYSGSKIYLMKDSKRLFVRKIGNVERNYERLTALAQHSYNVPEIYNYDDGCLDMEYIHGLDVKTYLRTHNIDTFKHFVVELLESLASTAINKDYTDTYNNKLNWVNQHHDLPFSQEELVAKLPKVLPSSMYHGDLTLENIMYANNKFYIIDGISSEYDSYIFDIAKLRQDIECKWFIRNDNLYFDSKLTTVYNALVGFSHYQNDYLLILMLLRVFPYATPTDKTFLKNEIIKLWK